MILFHIIILIQDKPSINHVIFSYIQQKNSIFFENYLDWGTVEDWNRFKRSYATLFLDIDGISIINSSSHFHPTLETLNH